MSLCQWHDIQCRMSPHLGHSKTDSALNTSCSAEVWKDRAQFAYHGAQPPSWQSLHFSSDRVKLLDFLKPRQEIFALEYILSYSKSALYLFKTEVYWSHFAHHLWWWCSLLHWPCLDYLMWPHCWSCCSFGRCQLPWRCVCRELRRKHRCLWSWHWWRGPLRLRLFCQDWLSLLGPNGAVRHCCCYWSQPATTRYGQGSHLINVQTVCC